MIYIGEFSYILHNANQFPNYRTERNLLLEYSFIV